MKYKSHRTVCNQMHKHASKKEARRCDELTILEKQRKIKDLKQQPRFPLRNKFKFQGKTIREIVYVADFSYIDNRNKKYIIEDTKGFRTPVYLLKVKLLKFIMKDCEDFIFLES